MTLKTKNRTFHNSNRRNSPFSVEHPLDDYILLSPIGVFPHSRGLQNVDRTALDNLVKNFKSFFARLGRRFAGLPFYVGHPDVHGLENTYTDRKAYGWIMDLQVRDDGLYGRTKWSDAGRELIANGHYKFLSPTWTAEKTGAQSGQAVYRPTHLVSVGLTNEPNLPVPPLANSEDCHDGEETVLGTALPVLRSLSAGSNPVSDARSGLSKIPGFPARGENAEPHNLESFGDELENAETFETDGLAASPGRGKAPKALIHNSSADLHPAHQRRHASPSPDGSRQTAADPTSESSHPDEDRLVSLERSLANCQREVAELQQHLVSHILDNAIAGTRILPAERKLWQHQLSEDFASASAALANAKPQLNLTARTDNLPRGTSASNLSNSQKKGKIIHSLINEKMHREGVTYHQAWVTLNEDRPELFEHLASSGSGPAAGGSPSVGA